MFSRPSPDQMILMNAVLYLSTPQGGSAYLISASVSLDDKEVSSLQGTAFQLAIKELYLMQLVKV